jgi:ABC-type oligopeptide transport system substrate-binding subunit
VRRLALFAVLALAAFAFWRVANMDSGRAPVPPQPAPRMLVRGNGSDVDSLDPQLVRYEPGIIVLRDAYEGLTTIGRDGGVAPGVAESWVVTDGGRTYTFRLRTAARWSNGDPVTAADFVAGWRRLVDPRTGAMNASLLAPVENAVDVAAGRKPPETLGVRAGDDRTLVVTLTAATGYFLALLSHPAMSPVHQPTLAAGHGFAKAGSMVTNGAFVPAEQRVGTWLLARRNPHYWNAAAVKLDAVRYETITDSLMELNRYRAREIDVTALPPAAPAARLRAEFGEELHVVPTLATRYYGFLLDRPPFADAPGVRRALAMAVDRGILVNSVLDSGQRPAAGWVPDGVAGYAPQQPDWAAWPMERRIAEARRLLAAAGYSAARPLSFELGYVKNETHQRVAIAVAAMWKQQLGVEVSLRADEFRSLRKAVDERRLAMFYGTWVADYNDAWTFLQALEPGAATNLVGYASEDYRQLLRQAGSAIEEGERSRLMQQAEARLLADAPLVPLYFISLQRLVAPRVMGWYDNPMNATYSKDLSVDGVRPLSGTSPSRGQTPLAYLSGTSRSPGVQPPATGGRNHEQQLRRHH